MLQILHVLLQATVTLFSGPNVLHWRLRNGCMLDHVNITCRPLFLCFQDLMFTLETKNGCMLDHANIPCRPLFLYCQHLMFTLKTLKCCMHGPCNYHLQATATQFSGQCLHWRLRKVECTDHLISLTSHCYSVLRTMFTWRLRTVACTDHLNITCFCMCHSPVGSVHLTVFECGMQE